MSFVILPKKDPKKLQNSWAPSLTTAHISLVGWDQGEGVVQLDCIANGGEDDDDDDFDEDNYDDDDYDLAPAVSQPDCIANVGEIA